MSDGGQPGFDGPFLTALSGYRGEYVPRAAVPLDEPPISTVRRRNGRPRREESQAIALALETTRANVRRML